MDLGKTSIDFFEDNLKELKNRFPDDIHIKYLEEAYNALRENMDLSDVTIYIKNADLIKSNTYKNVFSDQEILRRLKELSKKQQNLQTIKSKFREAYGRVKRRGSNLPNVNKQKVVDIADIGNKIIEENVRDFNHMLRHAINKYTLLLNKIRNNQTKRARTVAKSSIKIPNGSPASYVENNSNAALEEEVVTTTQIYGGRSKRNRTRKTKKNKKTRRN